VFDLEESRIINYGSFPRLYEYRPADPANRKESMTPKYYHIIFRGETLPGFQIEAVKQNLAAAFRLGPEHTGKLFAGKPVLMAKNVDLERAAKYKKIFENAGAVCEAVSVGSKQMPPFSGKDEKSSSLLKAPAKRSGFMMLSGITAVCLLVAVIIWYHLSENSVLRSILTYRNDPTTGGVWPLNNFEMISVLVSLGALSLLILKLRKRLSMKNRHTITTRHHTSVASKSTDGHENHSTAAMQTEAFGNQLRTARVIWGAIFITLPVYVGIFHFWGQDLAVDSGPEFPQGLLEKILCGAAVGMIMIAGFLRKLMLKAAKNGVGARLFKSTSISEAQTISAKYISAVIVSLALAESSAIYGIILFILGSGMHMLYLLVGLAAVALIIYRPKFEELAAFSQKMQSA
jgi:hypothetical protein